MPIIDQVGDINFIGRPTGVGLCIIQWKLVDDIRSVELDGQRRGIDKGSISNLLKRSGRIGIKIKGISRFDGS